MASFKGSVKRIQVLTRVVLAVITVTLSVFLIMLGNKILRDFDNWYRAPEASQFESKAQLAAIAKKEDAARAKVNALELQRANMQRSIDAAENKYNSEKESFDNWVRARGATGSTAENPAVIAKTRELDRLRGERDAAQKKLKDFDESNSGIMKEMQDISREKEKILARDRDRYSAAYRSYQLKVFFVRLLFALPILGIGIFVFIKFKRSRFWPLVWGYIIFSVYVFFVGLVPYLPDFGGYIRFIVGIILSGFIGYYAIKQLAKYSEKKKAELEASRETRARSIQEDVAVKAYRSHCCPSCEKDFLIKVWHPRAKQITTTFSEADAPNFCPHCGIELFGECPSCKNRIFIHFPYCSYCGAVKAQ